MHRSFSSERPPLCCVYPSLSKRCRKRLCQAVSEYRNTVEYVCRHLNAEGNSTRADPKGKDQLPSVILREMNLKLEMKMNTVT